MKKMLFYIFDLIMISLIITITILAFKSDDLLFKIMISFIDIILIITILSHIQSMNYKKIKLKINYNIILTVVVFAMFITLLSFEFYKENSKLKNSEKIYATIYDVEKNVEYETKYDEDGNKYEEKIENCDLLIKYSVNNKEYKNKLKGYSCRKKIGNTVKIYYDRNDPLIISYNMPWIIIGLIFIISIASLVFICWFKNRKNIKLFIVRR